MKQVLKQWLLVCKSAGILRRIRKIEQFYSGRAQLIRMKEMEAIMHTCYLETQPLGLPEPVEVDEVPEKYFSETEYQEQWFSFFNRKLTRDQIKILRDLYWAFRIFEQDEMDDECELILDLAVDPLIETDYDHNQLRLQPQVINYVASSASQLAPKTEDTGSEGSLEDQASADA